MELGSTSEALFGCLPRSKESTHSSLLPGGYQVVDGGEMPAFCFLANDGIVTPHPPIARALSTVKSALEYGGYELLDWKPPSNNECLEIHVILIQSELECLQEFCFHCSHN